MADYPTDAQIAAAVDDPQSFASRPSAGFVEMPEPVVRFHRTDDEVLAVLASGRSVSVTTLLSDDPKATRQ